LFQRLRDALKGINTNGLTFGAFPTSFHKASQECDYEMVLETKLEMDEEKRNKNGADTEKVNTFVQQRKLRL
jgi:hypothetical protein